MTAGTASLVDLRRPRSVVEIIADALRCYRRDPVLFAVLAAAVVAPYALIVLLVSGAAPLGAHHETAAEQLTLILLDSLLVTPLISALHIHALVVIGEGTRPRILDVARRGMRVLPVVAAAQILAMIGSAIGFVLLIVPGVILLIRWAVVAQAAAVERVDWRGALRRSGQLTAGNYAHILGLNLVVAAGEFGILQAGGALIGTGSEAAQVLIGIVIETIIRSFAALASAFLFFDLVARTASRRRPADPVSRTPRDFDQPA